METKSNQFLSLLPHLQLREFEGNSTPANAAVPVRILREVLLVIVSPELGNPTETATLIRGRSCAGRLSVDTNVDPPVGLHWQPRLTA
jgi:hypothetical protein